MSNFNLGFVNRALEATITASGATFVAGSPATKIGTAQPTDYARTTDTSDVTFLFDFGSARNIRLVGLTGDNLDGSGTVAIKLGSTSGGTNVYDGADLSRWSFTPFNGIYTNGDPALGNPHDYLLKLPATYSARYASMVLKNATNAAGFIQAGMAWFSDHMDFDFELMQEGFLPSITEYKIPNEMQSGTDYSEVLNRNREQKLVLPLLKDSERDRMYDAMLRYGTSSQLIYMPRAHDAAFNQRYGFIGKFRELSPVEFPGSRYARLPLAIRRIT